MPEIRIETMMYQARHYRSIASLIADLRLRALDAGDLFMLETIDVFQARLVETFRRDNSRFKPAKFATACGKPLLDATIARSRP